MRFRWFLWIALSAWTTTAMAGDRRDIVFECPCSAEWAAGADSELGTLTLVGGIRSFRAVESGALLVFAFDGSNDAAAVGSIAPRGVLRGRWSIPFDRPEPDEVIELPLLEIVGEGPNGETQWHRHESLALWPAPGRGASGAFVFVDLLTDSDGDGIGDVNEELAGTSWEDRESFPAGLSSVDVLALYSDDFEDAEGGGPQTRLLHVLTVADALYGDSGTNIQLRIVGMSEVDVGEYGWAVSEHREELMEEHGADVSVQFHPCDTCFFAGTADLGASLSGRWLGGHAWDTVGSGPLTAHELGHVMGLVHSARQGETDGAFRWSRGHYVSPHGETNPRFGTIMSYGGLGSLGLRDLFSNPLADCGLGPCGVPRREIDGADATASLDLMRFQIAANRKPARDSDGDGFVDAADALPDDPNDWFDLDGDGIGDNADDDDDNDGVADVDDAFPANPDEWADVDFDGIGDNADDDVRDLSPFRDPELRAAVEEALGKETGSAISGEEMSSLRELDAGGRGIRDLTGLEQAVGLEELRLGANRLTDIEPLAGLKSLRFLGLSSNPALASVRPLSGLTRLNHLELSYSGVTDVAPLSGLTNLKRLDLNYNEVADVGPLAGLAGLNHLDLGRNRITDLGALSGLTNLNYVDLNENEVTDLGPLAGLTGLEYLDLSRNRATDLEPLSSLKNLVWLRLGGNPVSDLSPLSGLTALYELDVGRSRVEDISPLTGLTQLHVLGLGYTQVRVDDVLAAFAGLRHLDVSGLDVSSLSALSEMVTLTSLVLDNNIVADVAPLAKLQDLIYLSLAHNRVSDLTALAKMEGLEALVLGNNTVADIAPLGGLQNLRYLHLQHNGISDVTALAKNERLRSLGLADNAISDLSPLSELRELEALNLERNQIADVSPLSDMRSLRELRVESNAISDIGPLADGTVLTEAGSLLYMSCNPLNDVSVTEHIPTLESRGVDVVFDTWCERTVAIPIADPTLHAVVAEAVAGGLGHVDDHESNWELDGLWQLHVAGRGLISLQGLGAAKGLEALSAASNRIGELSPLAELPRLNALDLRDNRISDISPLAANDNLGAGAWVALDGNPLSEVSLNEHIPALLARGVDIGVGRIRLTLLVGGERLRFDTSGYFEVILGVGATLSASVAQADLVEAGMDDGALVVTPGDRVGQVTVTVTGENGAGETHALTFAVTVRGPWQVPLVPNTMDAVRQGFVRVVNHGLKAAETRIAAMDDDGTRHEGLTLAVGPGEAVHFNSSDLEAGNADKGLTGGSGRGSGDWRLEVESTADLTVLSYVRTADGFLTPMRNVSPTRPGVWDLPTFNPASNADQASSLRIANLGEERAEVVVTGIDDRGRSPGSDVRIEIPGGATRTLTAPELEGGPVDARGSLGDGDGKWRLRVESAGALAVINLLRSPEGHLTDLSTVPDGLLGEEGVRTVPLFPSASDEKGRQGFVRVVNRTESDGEVEIAAFDDAGRRYESLKLVLKAGRTVHFNSDDVELGNEAKGLSGSTGPGSGDWRLEMRSDLDIRVLAYVRTPGGFLTAMHDVVSREGRRYEVATFNPASNADQVSRLRIVNPGSRPAHVAIAGIDDGGNEGREVVQLSVAAGAARTLSSVELEGGGSEQRGRLGDGRGKWRLQVDCEQPIFVMNLLDSRTGHMTNLSTGSPNP